VTKLYVTLNFDLLVWKLNCYCQLQVERGPKTTSAAMIHYNNI